MSAYPFHKANAACPPRREGQWQTGFARRSRLLAFGLCLALAGCQSLAVPDFKWRKPAPSLAANGPAGNANAAASPSLPPPVSAARARLAFVPLSGAPRPIADQLAKAIAHQSTSRQLQLTSANDPAVTYLIKGYISTAPDGDKTQLVYVWDILGTDRRRLHRISGWTHIVSVDGDPWASVGPAAIDTVASASLDALVAWFGTS